MKDPYSDAYKALNKRQREALQSLARWPLHWDTLKAKGVRRRELAALVKAGVVAEVSGNRYQKLPERIFTEYPPPPIGART